MKAGDLVYIYGRRLDAAAKVRFQVRYCSEPPSSQLIATNHSDIQSTLNLLEGVLKTFGLRLQKQSTHIFGRSFGWQSVAEVDFKKVEFGKICFRIVAIG